MASVNSRFRTFIKPLLYRLMGENAYTHFQYLGKVRDIEKRLVEEEELQLLPLILKEDDNVLDIGANYAYYTHRLAKICCQGTVYAFEPIPFTYNVCRKIVRRYQFSNVELFQKGVGARNQKMEFRVPIADFGGISAGQAHLTDRNNELEGKLQHYKFEKSKTFTCDVVTIDSLLPDIQKLAFVKIDIEGAELFALQGMKCTVERCRPVILIEINPFFLDGFSLSEQELRDYFRPLNYDFFVFNGESSRLTRYGDKAFVEKNYIMLDSQHQQKFAHLIDAPGEESS